MPRAGFSLIEAQVALLVLGAGLLAIAGTAASAMRLLRRAEAEQGAALVAASVLDSLAQVEAPAAGGLQSGRYRVDWTVAPQPGLARTRVVVRYAAGDGVRADTFDILAGPWPAWLTHAP